MRSLISSRVPNVRAATVLAVVLVMSSSHLVHVATVAAAPTALQFLCQVGK
jgi:hypothetical protein